jgi:hypothetical protein
MEKYICYNCQDIVDDNQDRIIIISKLESGNFIVQVECSSSTDSENNYEKYNISKIELDELMRDKFKLKII